MSSSALSNRQTLKLKYAVELRRARVEGADSDRPYVGLENIESGTGRLIAAATAQATEGEFAPAVGDSLSAVFQAGDILFGKLRPYLAKAWIADFDGRCSTELLPLRPEKIEPRFGLYVILSQQFIDAVDASTFGSKMPRADWEFIGNLPIPLPSQRQQSSIAHFLDRETADIDALIAAKQLLLDLLAEKRRAIVTEAIMRGLNPAAPLRPSSIDWLGYIPAHWEAIPLRFLVSFSGGATPDTRNLDYWSGSIPWVSPKDMKQDFIDDAEDHVSEAALENSALKMIEPEAILIVVRGMILAHSFPTAINTVPVTINQDMKALRCAEKIAPAFLMAVLKGAKDYLVSLADSSAHGTKKLETEALGRLEIPMPPIDEQHEIVRHTTTEIAKIDRLRAATEHSIALLKERRGALIAAAVTGQIDISEAV